MSQGVFYDGGMRIQNRSDDNELQLSLTLPAGRPAVKCPSKRWRRKQRRGHAGLWFDHMRRVVDQASPSPQGDHKSRSDRLQADPLRGGRGTKGEVARLGEVASTIPL